MPSGELYQTFQLLTSNLRWIECARNLTKNGSYLRLTQLRRINQFEELCFCGEKNGILGDP
jgi:hypothetical protein